MTTSIKVSYFGCGININNQLNLLQANLYDSHRASCPMLCCCFMPVSVFKRVVSLNESEANKDIQISVSHIVWVNGKEWKVTGFISNALSLMTSITRSSMVRSCEKRLVYLNENQDIFVYTSNNCCGKKLTLQRLTTGEEQNEEVTTSNASIKNIVVEDNSLLIIDDDGKLFSSGIEIPLQGTKISQVSVGKEHCLALTETGEVLSWGSGMRGQLGNGEIKTVEHPEVISSLEGLEIRKISSGGWHSTALSTSGDVYMWGWNDVGQLGFPSKGLRAEDSIKWDDIFGPWTCQCPASKAKPADKDLLVRSQSETSNEKSTTGGNEEYINPNRDIDPINVQATPKLLDFWKLDLRIEKVACGDRHTLFLLENGTAWATGWNLYGQLGIGSNVSQDEPRQISLPGVKDVFAGGWNSIIAVTEEVL